MIRHQLTIAASPLTKVSTPRHLNVRPARAIQFYFRLNM
jgi:hypothetical protein